MRKRFRNPRTMPIEIIPPAIITHPGGVETTAFVSHEASSRTPLAVFHRRLAVCGFDPIHSCLHQLFHSRFVADVEKSTVRASICVQTSSPLALQVLNCIG